MGHMCHSDISCYIIILSIIYTFLLQVPSTEDGTYRFAAQTMASNIPALITVSLAESGTGKLTVNCEKMVIGTMLMKDIKGSLES